MKIDSLLKQLPDLLPCGEGLNQLITAKTDAELIDTYIDRIDFCLTNDFPGADFMKGIQPQLAEKGIFIDRKRVVLNPEKLVLLGRCDFEATFDGYSVSRIYANHSTSLFITAKDNSVVVVDALNDSKVFVKTHGNARVHVNLYSKAECTGATKIVAKNKETYEL